MIYCKSGIFRENFSRIFANSMPREFKVLANKEFLYAIKTAKALIRKFKTLRIIRKYKSHAKISGFTVFRHTSRYICAGFHLCDCILVISD